MFGFNRAKRLQAALDQAIAERDDARERLAKVSALYEGLAALSDKILNDHQESIEISESLHHQLKQARKPHDN